MAGFENISIGAGGSGGSENIDKFVYFGLNQKDQSIAAIAMAANLIPNYELEKGKSLWLVVTIGTEKNNPLEKYKVTSVAKYKVKDLGSGFYGLAGDKVITSANLELIGFEQPTTQSILQNPQTQVINLPELGTQTIFDYVNNANPTIVIQDQSIAPTLLKTPTESYLFLDNGGNYGVGGITITTLADYELLSETATPPTIDAEVIEKSTNAVSGGGVYDFVQPILDKEVPIITDSFTILDSVDSKRKKLTFDNLINYVKVFIDNSLALFKTTNFLDATSSIQTQINSALNRTFAQLVGSAAFITNSARIFWINGFFNSNINQESLDFTFYNQPNNQYKFLRINFGGISTRKVYNGDSYSFEFPEGNGVGAFQPEITTGTSIIVQKFKTYINTVNTIYYPASVLTDNFEFTIRVIAGTATFSSTSFVFYPGDNVILRYFSGVWTVFNINNPTLNVLPKKGASGFVDSSIFDNGNVGIGTTTPTEALDVVGNGKFSGLVTASNGTLLAGTGTTNKLAKFTASGAVGNSGITELPSGNVGIGTSSPDATLHVEDNLFTTMIVKGNEGIRSGELQILNNLNRGISLSVTGSSYASGLVNDARISPIGTGANTISIGFNRGTGTPALIANVSNNNVGINQTNPTERLDVIGNGKFSGTLSCGQFTTATEPPYVKGASFFNTTLSKMRIGGATAYETVTSS
jgi:hypothetical protein